MKKKLLLLLLPLLTFGLSSCVLYNGQGRPGKSSTPVPASNSSTPSGDSSVTPPNPAPHSTDDDSKEGDKITVYLVFGQYGQYEGELVTSKEESLFLEHVKKMTDMVVGSDLPGKDKVTSSVEGSVFQTWVMYKNDGKLTEYTKVPAIDKAILYATFSGGSGGGSQGGGGSVTPSEYKPSSSTETATTGFGFKFSGAHETYMLAEPAEDFEDFKQYKFTNRAFKKNQEFQIWDYANNAGWADSLDGYSFGGTSATSEVWKSYLSIQDNRYIVLQDFNASSIYLKLKWENNQVYFALG